MAQLATGLFDPITTGWQKEEQTMNPPELIQLAESIQLNSDHNFALRIEFGVACAERVAHLLTDQSVMETLMIGKAFVRGDRTESELLKTAKRAKQLASSHPGSGSLDGAGSAAVSSSYGVAAALAGNALVAAEYTAYASVYSYAGFAVTDLSAYKAEHDWQVNKLRELATRNNTLKQTGDNEEQ